MPTKEPMMSRLVLASVAVAAGCIGVSVTAAAHHSFAMFDLTQHVLIEGTVTDWHYNNPHSWLYIQAPDENGEMKTWSFEGAAPVHATRQGVTGDTFRKGETVRVVMSPLRDGRPAGAMCFVVKEDGSFARPNDGICNSEEVIATWKTNAWLEKTDHLAGHPAAPR
jgi:Family of unknown function (DUF6152)